MAAGPGPLKPVDIAEHCGLPPSTLNRIIRSLSDWGYLFRTSEKHVVRNFRMERNVPMSERFLAKLHETIHALSAALNVLAEVVVVAGHELPWHSAICDGHRRAGRKFPGPAVFGGTRADGLCPD